MDKKYLEEKVKIAKELVADVEESYKMAAFGVVLTNLLDSDIEGKNVIRKTIVEKKGMGTSLEIDITNNMTELATNCELTPEELGDVITIKNGEVEIVAPISGNEAEQQVVATQCVLLVHEIVFKNDWVKTSVIKEALRKSGIQDKSSHLAKYLKNKPTIFRVRGAGHGVEYKLTTQGRTSSFQTIHNLTKGEKLED